MEYKFIVRTPPDQECIDEFYKSVAQGLINKHGVEFMREVVRTLKETKEN